MVELGYDGKGKRNCTIFYLETVPEKMVNQMSFLDQDHSKKQKQGDPMNSLCLHGI